MFRLIPFMKKRLWPVTPKAAIIIPVHNVTAFLQEALESAISQNYPNKQIIVVDDGSGTTAANEIHRLCKSYGNVVTLLKQPHAGAAVARDTAVHHTDAELILFLDADDILLPGALQLLADTLRNHPSAIAAYALVECINKTGQIIEYQPPVRQSPLPSGRKLLISILEKRLPFSNGSICIRRQALLAVPPRHHNIRYGEDWMLWCRLALAGNIVPAGSQAVLHYRKHGQSVCASSLDNPQELFATFDRIYEDTEFIAALGNDTLLQLRKRLLSRMHMDLAVIYLKRSMPEKAAYHMSHIEIAPSALSSACPL